MPAESESPTFCERVADFRDWFVDVAERFDQLLSQEQSDEIIPEMNSKIAELLPGLSWVVGPAPDGGHSFTLTGKGEIPKQLLTEYWVSQMPEIKNWTFYAARQPSPPDVLGDLAIGIGEDAEIDAETLLLATDVDEENEVVHVTVWHPAFESVGEEHHMNIAFIFLDEALGEFGVQMWLGEVDVAPIEEGTDTRKLADLPQFIQSVAEYHKWEKTSPLDSYTLYQISEQGDYPRGDTLYGTTCVPWVVSEFMENSGVLSEDPLEGTGAELVYVALDSSLLPEGQEVEVRSEIEDKIDEALRNEAGGRSLGGAYGTKESYIDLLLLDGEHSRHTIELSLAEQGLASRARIENFIQRD